MGLPLADTGKRGVGLFQGHDEELGLELLCRETSLDSITTVLGTVTHMLEFPPTRKLRQEDPKFEASLDQLAKPCLEILKWSKNRLRMSVSGRPLTCGALVPSSALQKEKKVSGGDGNQAVPHKCEVSEGGWC